MADQPGPPDPFRDLDAAAASNVELFNAHVRAGMPPSAAAIMIGTWMATLGALGQQGDDGS